MRAGMQPFSNGLGGDRLLEAVDVEVDTNPCGSVFFSVSISIRRSVHVRKQLTGAVCSF